LNPYLQALSIFHPLALAFGIPPWIVHPEGSKEKPYLIELHEAGTRAMRAQEFRRKRPALAAPHDAESSRATKPKTNSFVPLPSPRMTTTRIALANLPIPATREAAVDSAVAAIAEAGRQ